MSEPMVYTGDRPRPIAEVKDRAARIASGLRALGLEQNDRYAIIMRNGVGFVEATLAGGLIGAVPVPVNWHWTGEDLKHLLSNSGVKVAVVHTDLLPAVRKHKPDHVQIVEAETAPEIVDAYGLGSVRLTGDHPSLEQLAVENDPVTDPNTVPPNSVIYTSGTTGLAKGIIRDPMDPAWVPELATAIMDLLKFRPGEPTLVPAPMYHSSPNVHFIWAVSLGVTTHIMPRFIPTEFLRMVDQYKIASTQMVPVMFRRLLAVPEEERSQYDLSSLKAIVHAATPCPADLKAAMIDWLGPIIFEYYGGSEGGAWTYATSEDSLARPGTVGKAWRDCEIKILDPATDEEVPTGETGIVYGKPGGFWPDFTYIANDEKRRDIARGKFFTVGDIGHVDAEGFLYLSDRANDMVISGGVNIYPAEIEASLHNLEGVEDVAVFGIPDPDMGEALAAHIQPRAGVALTEDDVRRHVRDSLAAYKVPKVIVFEERLPREDTGKLFKRRLKAQYWEGTDRISG
ncbi:AMP-binding protein [Blastococcus sp. Marseille-P5729]|uniref:AMP-binding protein n=1 Tax=Blastococcus sp. Marseille-P5729 TaxID=2086582 RepID=UPI000D1119A3|nr:AMP-binding protein [Blastococcus sp. Marseille-P5729]